MTANRLQLDRTAYAENSAVQGDAALIVADCPCGAPAQTYFNLWLICAGCPHSSRSGRAAPVHSPQPQAGAAFYQAVRPLLRCPFAIASPGTRQFERVTS
jgi:hypothetical protein